MTREMATFGAGCFWGVEAAFRRSFPALLSTAVGYSGGHSPSPSYRQVCSGSTGHAEVCLLQYDPSTTPYSDLLALFWRIHDPTQLNRQGPDIGSQYRSCILYHSPQQKAAAEASLLEQQAAYGDRKVVTEIRPAGVFWRAEEYHQQYLSPDAACHKI